MRTFFPILLLAVWAGASAVVPAEAQRQPDDNNRRVVVVNTRSSPMTRLYGSRTATSDWEENILSEPIPPGARIVVNFDDGTGACSFDFRAVFKDSQVVYRWSINVCVESEWWAVD